MAATPQWTIRDMKLYCNLKDTRCQWSFSIDNGSAPPQPCSYSAEGSPACQASTGPNSCGVFTVSSGWSDSFGSDSGFTTISVVDEEQRLIIYPSYSDRELEDGDVPDKQYTPQKI
ncbi:hypothetical protein FE257_000468 [Aspergillus nanangensis]|uniref:Uncharacterized protein n=1 Tax=Aspergillus nanangensis TaxID=2582783 RepID=A0AAD4CUC9_ASPNN|nr:hypothetical protein FE257_000468 [Aspergillus nanangensis]